MPDPMRTPEIAEELRELAATHGLPRLAELADELRRRPPTRRAPVSSERMTPELRAQIRKFAASFPDLVQSKIAEHFNVSQGRVSETLAGYRE
ncbi:MULTISPECIES: hypothetical protein [Methylobacterium]|nr:MULTISPECIES: hypothetical protein [Methylobacterium]